MAIRRRAALQATGGGRTQSCLASTYIRAAARPIIGTRLCVVFAPRRQISGLIVTGRRARRLWADNRSRRAIIALRDVAIVVRLAMANMPSCCQASRDAEPRDLMQRTLPRRAQRARGDRPSVHHASGSGHTAAAPSSPRTSHLRAVVASGGLSAHADGGNRGLGCSDVRAKPGAGQLPRFRAGAAIARTAVGAHRCVRCDAKMTLASDHAPRCAADHSGARSPAC